MRIASCFRLFVVGLLGSILFFSSSACAAVLFVDNLVAGDCVTNYNISSRRCDGSAGAKFDTIQEGVRAAGPGDTISIRAGVYRLTSSVMWYPQTTANGLPGQPITLAGYLTETVVIDGQGTVDVLFFISPPDTGATSWWVFRDFTIRNARQNLIAVSYGKDLIFENIIGHGTPKPGGENFYVGGKGEARSERITFRRVTGFDGQNIWHVGGGCNGSNCNGAPVSAGATGTTIIDSIAYDAGADCFKASNTAVDTVFIRSNAYQCADAAYDLAGSLVVIDSMAHDSDTGMKLWDSQKVLTGGKAVIRGTRVWNNRNNGIETGVRRSDSDGGGGGDDLVAIENCTVVDNKINIVVDTSSDRGHSSYLSLRNTLATHAQYNGACSERLALKVLNELANNLLLENHNVFHRDPNDPPNACGGGDNPLSEVISYRDMIFQASQVNDGSWERATGFGAGSRSFDPRYVNFAQANFELRSESEAVDRGSLIPLYHCETPGRHPGHDCRVWFGTAPDIGAIEYDPHAGKPFIKTSFPPTGYVDPRADQNPNTGDLLGVSEVTISFSESASDQSGSVLTEANFEFRYFRGGEWVSPEEADLGRQGEAPQIDLLRGEGAGPYTLRISPRFPVGAWTEMRVVRALDSNGNSFAPGGDRIVLGAAPLDVNQDGEVSGLDLKLLAERVSQASLGSSTEDLTLLDQNRDGRLNGADLVRAIQLVNGIKTSRPWNNFSLGIAP